MAWYNPFSWFDKGVPDMLPDVVRQPVGPVFADVMTEYRTRRDAEKIVLILEGGGAKGRFQAGVLARLAEIGLLDAVDAYVGTSVGALNACVTSRYFLESHNLQKVVDVWRGVRRNEDIYFGDIPSGVWSGLKTVLGGGLTKKSVLDNSPMVDLVKKHLGAPGGKMAVPVYTICMDYVMKAKRVFGPGTDPVDMAISSASVPVFFPAWKDTYCDGGTVENFGLPTALGLGATKIIAVYADADASKIPARAPAPTSINTGVAALAAMYNVQSDKAYDDMENMVAMRLAKGLSPLEIIHIYPAENTGPLLDFGARPDLLQKGYDLAVKYVTPDSITAFLKA